MTKEQAIASVKQKKEMFVEVNDRIWEFAEMAFVEYRSAELLCQKLEEEGFQVERGVGGIETAFTGKFGSGYPVIGILGEYDALSGLNQKAGVCTREPTSPEMAGMPGHGCGHNIFAAGSLAAAVAVKEYLKNNPDKSGTVIFFGCPGEEGGSGKAFMAREGVFDGLDAALVWHPYNVNCVRSGSLLANNQIEYKFKGIAAHAASYPHRGRSALDAVELMNVGVQFLREHMPEGDRIHYAITDAGGLSPNVVQPEASVLYLVRSKTAPGVEDLCRRVNLIAQGAAMMTETELSIRFIKGCSNTVSNNVLERLVYNNLKDAELPKYTEEELAFCKSIVDQYPEGWTDEFAAPGKAGFSAYREMRKTSNPYINDFVLPYEPHETCDFASSDVGDVSWLCPTAWLNVATYPVGTASHSWQRVALGTTSIAHKGMLLVGEVLSGAAIDMINDPAIVEKAKAEHQERLGGVAYKCPIPKGVEPTIGQPGAKKA